jgi:hypothetical protein
MVLCTSGSPHSRRESFLDISNGKIRPGYDDRTDGDSLIFDAPSTYMPTHMLV